MMNGPIPPHVDPRKYADREITLKGEIALAEFARVCDLLSSDAGSVQVTLEFRRDEQKVALLHLTLQSTVQVICQRCLGDAALPVEAECTYAMVWPGTDESQLPKGYDALEVDEEPLALYPLIEDELLLALPIIPMHPLEDCHPVELDSSIVGEEVQESNPFSILAQLKKRDPNV